jgi:Tfp pilus assembly protein PilN
MEAVNLLPPEYRERKRPSRFAAAEGLEGRRTLRVGGAVLLLFVVLLGGLFYYEHSQVSSKRKELADTQARIAAISPQVQVVKDAQAAISNRLAAAQSITAGRMNWDRALTDFAKIIPASSYVTNLQISAPAPAPTTSAADAAATTTTTPAATGMTIQGVAPGTNGVALVMDRLSLLPWLSNVTLQGASRQLDGTSTFNLTAGVAQER